MTGGKELVLGDILYREPHEKVQTSALILLDLDFKGERERERQCSVSMKTIEKRTHLCGLNPNLAPFIKALPVMRSIAR